MYTSVLTVGDRHSHSPTVGLPAVCVCDELSLSNSQQRNDVIWRLARHRCDVTVTQE